MARSARFAAGHAIALAGLLLLSGCGLVADDPAVWSEWNDAWSKANALLERMDGRSTILGGPPPTASEVRAVLAVSTPRGADVFRDELIRLAELRSTLGREGILGTRSSDPARSAWRKEYDGLRERYQAWLVAHGR